MSYISEVKKAKNNKDTDARIREVCRILAGNYRKSSLIDMVMEYYTLCEIITESLNPELDNAKEEIKVINEAVRLIADGEELADILDDIVNVRKQITDKMTFVTTYVDRYRVYSCVLEQYDIVYSMSDGELDEAIKDYERDVYVRQIIDYISEAENNMEILDRINDVMECIPVRMSRKKYLNMVEKGLSLYEDSDKAAFDEYVYMLRSSAMLYECTDRYGMFDEYEAVYNELKDADYEGLDKDYYMILKERLDNAVAGLHNLYDMYMCLQKLVNMLYIYAVNRDEDINQEYQEFYNNCYQVLRELNDMISDESSTQTMPEEGIVKLEGYMEELYEARNILSTVAEDIELTYSDRIASMELTKQYNNLLVSGRIFSSPFVDIVIPENELVTKEYFENEKTKLMSELEQLIRNSSRQVARVVISITFSKLPLPFRNTNDIYEYIENVLEHCSNKAELFIFKRDIDMIIWW